MFNNQSLFEYNSSGRNNCILDATVELLMHCRGEVKTTTNNNTGLFPEAVKFFVFK